MQFFVRGSPRPEGSPSPSATSRFSGFSAIQANVRALLNGGQSPQPEVVSSPTRERSSQMVETPKLPPLDFLRASQHEDFMLPGGRTSEDHRSRQPSRSTSQRTNRSLRSLSRTRSRRSNRGRTSESNSRPSNVGPRPSHVGERPAIASSRNPLRSNPLSPQRANNSSQALPYHPADTAAAEARGQDMAAPAPVLIADSNYNYGAVNPYNHDLEAGYSEDESERSRYVDPETSELDAIVNRRRRRHRRHRHHHHPHYHPSRRVWTRRRSERAQWCGLVQGPKSKRKLGWVAVSGLLLSTALAICM
jgi:hypothetical protein